MHSRASDCGLVPGFQFQSFLRKFKSQQTRMPRLLASSTSASVDAKAFWLRAGVIPVTWTHATPSSAPAKSYSFGPVNAMLLPSRS